MSYSKPYDPNKPRVTLKNNRYPWRRSTVSVAQPVPDFIAGPDNVISVAFDTALMKPGSRNAMVSYYSALLFLQVCHYTGSRFINHGIRYGHAEAFEQERQVSNAFNKAGLPPIYKHGHWTRPHTLGEPHTAFVSRWKEEHPDTKKMVVVDDGTFASVPDFDGHKDLVLATSKRGFQLYHARRVVEAMDGDWQDFRAMRDWQLGHIAAKKSNTGLVFSPDPSLYGLR